MKPMNDFLTRQVKWLAIGLIAAAGTAYESAPARAFDGAAFLGGMLTSRVVGGFVRRDRARTQAQIQQAHRPPPAPQPQYAQPQYAAPPPRQVAAPAQPAGKSVEQRLKELESLASKGFISKQEYQARRKAILDKI